MLIYRLPLKEDLVFKRSSCPNCGVKIPWYHLIPILSYFILLAKCFNCQKKISFQYPFIEFLMGIVAFILFPENSENISILKYVIQVLVLGLMVAHFLIDIRYMILPDSINIILSICFIVWGLVEQSVSSMIMGFIVGGGIPYLVTYIYYKLRGQIGLGGGDIKLFAILGIYLGPMLIIQNIFLSCFVGATFSLVLLLAKKMDIKNPIPFGPFIIIIAVLQIFFSEFYHEMVRKIL